MANGYLDESKLALLDNFRPLDPMAKGLVLPEVAWQWHLMATACERDTGVRLDASEGYRSFAGQVYQKQKWTTLGKPGNAALPGTSTHGEALAIDAGSGAGTDGTPVETWLQEHAHEYGFSRPFWYELWHLLYVGNPTITKEEDMTPTQAAQLEQVLNKVNKVDDLQKDLDRIKAELIGSDPKMTRLQETVIILRNLNAGDSRLKEAVLLVRSIAVKLGIKLKK